MTNSSALSYGARRDLEVARLASKVGWLAATGRKEQASSALMSTMAEISRGLQKVCSNRSKSCFFKSHTEKASC